MRKQNAKHSYLFVDQLFCIEGLIVTNGTFNHFELLTLNYLIRFKENRREIRSSYLIYWQLLVSISNRFRFQLTARQVAN